MEDITKKCTKCGEVKSLSAFSKDKSRKSGYHYTCKCCEKDYIKVYCKAYSYVNKEKIKNRLKVYYEANKDEIKSIQKTYKKVNKDKIKDYKKNYYEANKDKLNAHAMDKVKQLSDGYIAKKLRIPLSDCPPELIELKRAQLKLIRAIKQQP